MDITLTLTKTEADYLALMLESYVPAQYGSKITKAEMKVSDRIERKLVNART